ncbi:MAG: ribonuclease J, partial [Anaerolineales bacterium]|nr:ribonuclease J [Anaerolineales bacterium]
RQFDLIPGDTVVLSSHPIPGNEETVSKVINRLFQRGAKVIYDPIAAVHVSGHASQDEIIFMLNLVKPKFLVPVHGELRHLHQHAALARGAGMDKEHIAVIENGQALEFRSGEMHLAERVPGGYVFVDGSGVGDIGPSVMREREALARDGFVFVNLRLDAASGSLLDEPEIITRGFVYLRDSEQLMAETRRQIEKVVSRSNGNLQGDVEHSLRNFLYDATRRRPMIFVVVN